MSLPFLPGYTVNEPNRGKKVQTLVYHNGYAVPRPTPQAKQQLVEAVQTGSPNKDLTWDPNLTFPVLKKEATVAKSPKTQLFPELGSSSMAPNKVMVEPISHNVLSFEGYWMESVAYSPVESNRVRKCTVNFFLEDDTILMKEKKNPNAGIPQGVLIKRQKIPKGNPLESKDYYRAADLNVGADVTFFGKKIHLVDCDFFTRSYLQDKLAINVGATEDFPADNYAEHRKRVESPPKSYQPNAAKGQLKKFLESDGKVLRFYCYWDNRENLFGEIRPFIIHYFLVDDTVEVREVQANNSGHYPFSVFLKRQKLPKPNAPGQLMGDRDFRVGETVNIFGRPFFLYDCDLRTKEYYRSTYNLDIQPVKPPGFQEEPPTQVRKPAREEPKKNFQKMLDNERKVLRFGAKLKSEKVEDKNRSFIISYFLADDTISIYEPAQRNSGIVGGKFLQRQRVPKPGNEGLFQPNDLFVGAEVQIFHHKFVLEDADQYAFNFMEANPDDFPLSDIDKIQQKLHEMLLENPEVDLQGVFTAMDADQSGFINAQEFRDALVELGFELTEQEIVTLIRRYDLDGDGSISYEEFALALNLPSSQ